MALLLGNSHSVLVAGNLKNSNSISVNLPFDDFKTNLWQIRINEIAIDFKALANIILGISTNFVTDIKFNDQNQIVNYFPILSQIVFKGAENEKKVFRLESAWFYIKNSETELKLTFHSYKNLKVSNALLKLDCDVFVTVILQRVK